MKLADLAAEYIAKESATGLFVPDEAVGQSLIEATRFYAGFAAMKDPAAAVDEDGVLDPAVITDQIDVTAGEWALIRPLFMLYVEMQGAKVIEASRGVGLEPLGRTTSEIAADIKVVEDNMGFVAFSEDCFTVGIPDVWPPLPCTWH